MTAADPAQKPKRKTHKQPASRSTRAVETKRTSPRRRASIRIGLGFMAALALAPPGCGSDRATDDPIAGSSGELALARAAGPQEGAGPPATPEEAAAQEWPAGEAAVPRIHRQGSGGRVAAGTRGAAEAPGLALAAAVMRRRARATAAAARAAAAARVAPAARLCPATPPSASTPTARAAPTVRIRTACSRAFWAPTASRTPMRITCRCSVT